MALSNSNSEKGATRSTHSLGSGWTLFNTPQIQPDAVDLLRKSLLHDRMSSAWLISGIPGAGQWPTALWLAALMNCRGKESDTADMFAALAPSTALLSELVKPCGSCSSCRQIAALNHPSLVLALPVSSTKNQEESIEVQSEAIEQRRKAPFALREHSKAISISIDAIRSLRRRLGVQADSVGSRVVILDEIERSKPESIDALLKLIEEPPDRTLIVMTTSAPRALAATIHSRVRRLSLRPIAPEVIDRFLAAAGVEVASEREQLVRWSRGSMGVADSLRDNDDTSSIARDLAVATLGHTFSDNPGTLLSMLSRSFPEFSSTEAPRQLAREYLRFLQILVNESLQESAINAVREGTLLESALRAPWRARRLTELLENTLDDIRRNVHIRTMIFSFVIRWRRILHESRPVQPVHSQALSR